MAAALCWKVLNAIFLSLVTNCHFTINAISNSKRTRQNLGTNWNAKPICDVRCLQQSLEPATIFRKQLHLSNLAAYNMANKLGLCFLCLIFRLVGVRISITDGKVSASKKVQEPLVLSICNILLYFGRLQKGTTCIKGRQLRGCHRCLWGKVSTVPTTNLYAPRSCNLLWIQRNTTNISPWLHFVGIPVSRCIKNIAKIHRLITVKCLLSPKTTLDIHQNYVEV